MKSFLAFVGYILVSVVALYAYPMVIEYCARIGMGEAAYAGGGFLYLVLIATIVISFFGILLTIGNGLLRRFPLRTKA